MKVVDHPQSAPATFLAIGCLAAMASASGHEAVGHGMSCVAVGGRVTLLTTTHFSCAAGSWWVDAAGPAMNLILAAIGALGFRLTGTRAPWLRRLLLALAIFNTFWFAGEALRSSLTDIDDEAAIARTLSWPPGWRAACLAFAVCLYGLAMRSFVQPLREVMIEGAGKPSPTAMLLAGGALSLAIGGLFWRRDPLGGAMEGLLAVGAASAPILLSARVAERRGATAPPATVRPSVLWIVVALAVLAVFCVSQGRGFVQSS